jgi:aminoglycoside 6'-N-acetyltransferase
MACCSLRDLRSQKLRAVLSCAMRIAFRPLAETDLDELHAWLNRPHLARFFQKRPISRAEVEAKFGPIVRREDTTHSHLAFEAGAPLGYIQCYRITDNPDWAALIQANEGIGVDLAIIEPTKPGRGFGRVMLASYLGDVAFPLYPAESKCFIGHELENEAAIACSRSVGFEYVRDFVEGGIPSALFVLERDKSALAFG